jgi:hypothetical protein
MVRKLVVLVAVMCVATATWAGPKDKSKGALINNTDCRGTTDWNNEVVKATYSADANKMKIAWKGTGTGLDGKDVYCFLSASSRMGGSAGETGNCLVMKAQPEGGKLSMKGLVASVAMGVIPDTVQYNNGMACYVDAAGTFDPAAACAGSAVDCGFLGCVWLAQDTVNFKDDNIVGVCENLDNGSIPCDTFPSGTPLAVSGIGSFPETPNAVCP